MDSATSSSLTPEPHQLEEKPIDHSSNPDPSPVNKGNDVPKTWEEAQKAGFSKKGWRRALKKTKKLAFRPIARAKERELRREKRKKAKEDGTFVPKPKKYRMAESINKHRICIDLDFSKVG